MRIFLKLFINKLQNRLTRDSEISIMINAELQNEYFNKGGMNVSEVKIGLTIEEAAECTGIGRNTMRKLVDWGKLPVLKVGRKTIIRTDTLEHFMTVNQGRNLLVEKDVRKVE